MGVQVKVGEGPPCVGIVDLGASLSIANWKGLGEAREAKEVVSGTGKRLSMKRFCTVKVEL